MLETFLGQAKTLFGKTFIIAGILPSVVFLVGMKWYEGGSIDSVASMISSTFAEPTKLTAGAIITLGQLLAVSLILFASRGFVFNLVEDVPIRWPGFLRHSLVTRQRRLRQESIDSAERDSYVLTAVRWSVGKRKFYTPRSIPNAASNVDRDTVLSSSAKARALVAADAPSLEIDRAYVNAENFTRVSEALYGLYLLAYEENQVAQNEKVNAKSDRPGVETRDTTEKEIYEWRKLTDVAKIANYLNRVVIFTESQWNETRKVRQQYPENELWVKPTGFGNRLSALNDYAESRYGISTGTLWPRLWRILTAEERSDMSDKQLLIEAYLNLSLVFLALFVIVLTSSLISSVETLRTFQMRSTVDWRAIVFVGSTLFLSSVAYVGAMFALVSFLDGVKSLVDLRCLQLLTALGYKAPFTVKTEKEIFSELDQFFAVSAQRLQSRDLVPPDVPKADPEKKKESNN